MGAKAAPIAIVRSPFSRIMYGVLSSRTIAPTKAESLLLNWLYTNQYPPNGKRMIAGHINKILSLTGKEKTCASKPHPVLTADIAASILIWPTPDGSHTLGN